MADSNAARQARHRRHKKGDHSVCRPGCENGRTPPQITVTFGDPGADFDARAELRALAAALKEAYAADPRNALLAKELRATLVELLKGEDGGEDPFTAFLSGLGTPVHTEVRDPEKP